MEMERNGTEQKRMEWSGKLSDAMKWNLMEWNVKNFNGVQWSGMEK